MVENKDKKVLNVPNKRELTPNQFDTAEHKEVRLKRNVPNLRFKEFEGEWKENYVNEICNEFKSGKAIKADLILDVGVYPVFGGNGLRGYTSTYNHDGLFVLIGRQGALCGNVRSVIGKTYITEHAIAVNGNDKSDTNFLHYLFLQMDLGRFSDQSAQPGLAVNKLLKLKVITPRIDEQRKIANFLRLLDERIATQNKIIEELKKLKNGISDKLFKSIKGAVKSLSSIGGIIKGKQINGEFLTDNGEYYVMNGGVEPSGYFDNYNVEANTISISEGGNSCGYVQFNTSPFWSGGHCYTIQKVTSTIDNLYLYHYLKSKEDEIMKLRIGTGLPNIKKKDLANFKIVIPEMEKQKKISNLLSLLERKIENSTALLSCLQAQKQHLLRQMFI